jgi:hypothetical protein
MFSICSAMALASTYPHPDRQHPLPRLWSRKMTMGMFVTGSTISPLDAHFDFG